MLSVSARKYANKFHSFSFRAVSFCADKVHRHLYLMLLLREMR